MLNITNYYNYDFIDTLNSVDEDGDKYTAYIFKFRGKDDNYYVSLSFFHFNPEHFSCDFQIEEDYINDNRNNINYSNRTYSNTNKFDSFMVLSTVIKIIYDFYEHNKATLHNFSFTADDDKRHNIYKHIFSKNFPTWKLTEDVKDEHGQWLLEYEF